MRDSLTAIIDGIAGEGVFSGQGWAPRSKDLRLARNMIT